MPVPSAVEESQKPARDNLQERRAQAIAAKAQEIEKVPMPSLIAAQWQYLAICLFKVSLSFKYLKQNDQIIHCHFTDTVSSVYLQYLGFVTLAFSYTFIIRSVNWSRLQINM